MILAGNATAAFFSRSLATMQSLRAEAESAQTQVATGERLAQPSDDPVASAQLRALARADRLAQIDSANAGQVRNELQSADAALNDITLALIRARELAIQAASDTASADARSAIADELGVLGETIFASANATSSSGMPLFAGETSSPAYTKDVAGAVTYAGDVAVGSLQISEGVTVERGLIGPAVFSFDNAGTPDDIFGFLSDLETSVRSGTDPAQSARDAASGFDTALANVTRGQTIIGARLNWIEAVEGTQAVRKIDRAQKSADLGGVDIADAITRMQQALTVLEASQASFARLASLTLFDRI